MTMPNDTTREGTMAELRTTRLAQEQPAPGTQARAQETVNEVSG